MLMVRIAAVTLIAILSLLGIVPHAVAERAPAKHSVQGVYRKASGDNDAKDVYLLFTFTENSCLTCLGEIRAIWCRIRSDESLHARVGAAVLFNCSRKGVARKVAEDFKASGCDMPFYQDTDGSLSRALFTRDNRSRMIIADAHGVVLQRTVGEMDDFSEQLQLMSGPRLALRYLDSIAAAGSGRAARTPETLPAPGITAKPKLLRSISLKGSDDAGMPYAESFSATTRRYYFISGLTNTLYEYDTTGKRLAALKLDSAIHPSCLQARPDGFYMVTGLADTVFVGEEGDDSIFVQDNVISAVVLSRANKITRTYAFNPAWPLSIANDIGCGAHGCYVTAQRTVTSTFMHQHNLSYDVYLKQLYDSANYARYIDTVTLIHELDKDFHIVRSFGKLPAELKAFGFKRTHFWIEFPRWILELPDGRVAYLHAASSKLRFFRGGTEASSVDLAGDYYQRLTGRETETSIPRFTAMILGENGMLYAQYDNPAKQKRYVVAVSPADGKSVGTYEVGSEERLVRADGAGNIHVLSMAGSMKINVYATR